jgi:hypothetical protein
MAHTTSELRRFLPNKLIQKTYSIEGNENRGINALHSAHLGEPSQTQHNPRPLRALSILHRPSWIREGPQRVQFIPILGQSAPLPSRFPPGFALLPPRCPGFLPLSHDLDFTTRDLH